MNLSLTFFPVHSPVTQKQSKEHGRKHFSFNFPPTNFRAKSIHIFLNYAIHNFQHLKFKKSKSFIGLRVNCEEPDLGTIEIFGEKTQL